jgi:hypothetical protein
LQSAGRRIPAKSQYLCKKKQWPIGVIAIGGYAVSFDLLPVCSEVMREAIASGAIVETYPAKAGRRYVVAMHRIERGA